MWSKTKLFDQSSSLKRASPFAGSATAAAFPPSIFIQLDCHSRIESIHQFIEAAVITLGSIATRE